MQDLSHWQGLPYYSIGLFYKKKFGQKVFKIPVSVAETCPNRDGLNGMKVCNFCDVWGSAAYPEVREQSLYDQIQRNKEIVGKRAKSKNFLVYFQAYTNTFSKVQGLREQFEVATQFEDVKGFVVGTRPDCISDATIDLWNEYIEKGYFVAVELGVQSFDENQLLWMDRGHTAKKSIWAVDKIRKNSKVDLGIHLMFGLPGETEADIVEAAKITNSLDIDNVKLHNLHVLKHTPLEKDFEQGRFVPIDRKNYVDRAILYVQHLRPEIAVHRMAALSMRSEELIAPLWVAKKMETYQYILDQFKENQAFQGQFYKGDGFQPSPSVN